MCDTSPNLQKEFSKSYNKSFSIPTINLSSCNRLMFPTTDCHLYYHLPKSINLIESYQTNKDIENAKMLIQSPEQSPLLDVIDTDKLSDLEKLDEDQKLESLSTYNTTKITANKETLENSCVTNSLSIGDKSSTAVSSLPFFPIPATNSFPNKFPLPTFQYMSETNSDLSGSDLALLEINRFNGMYPAFLHRRPRGEKRPIPEEQKDDKYYERRKRNNEAAKKSRDARKIREDRIAFRAALLEQENALLRTQILALRDELRNLRRLFDNSITTPPIT